MGFCIFLRELRNPVPTDPFILTDCNGGRKTSLFACFSLSSENYQWYAQAFLLQRKLKVSKFRRIAGSPYITLCVHILTELYYLTVPELKVQDQSVYRIGFFQGVSPWPIDCHLFLVSSHGFPSACVCVLSFSPYKEISLIELGPILWPHFNSIISLKALPPSTATFCDTRGLGLEHMNLMGDRIHSILPCLWFSGRPGTSG